MRGWLFTLGLAGLLAAGCCPRPTVMSAEERARQLWYGDPTVDDDVISGSVTVNERTPIIVPGPAPEDDGAIARIDPAAMVRRCLIRQKRRSPSNRINVAFLVDQDGTLANIKVLGTDAWLDICVRDELARIRFASPPTAPFQLNFPLIIQ